MSDALIWHPHPSSLKLEANVIHVWTFDLDQPEEIRQQFLTTFTEEEKTRANRFYFDHDRHRRFAAL